MFEQYYYVVDMPRFQLDLRFVIWMIYSRTYHYCRLLNQPVDHKMTTDYVTHVELIQWSVNESISELINSAYLRHFALTLHDITSMHSAFNASSVNDHAQAFALLPIRFTNEVNFNMALYWMILFVSQKVYKVKYRKVAMIHHCVTYYHYKYRKLLYRKKNYFRQWVNFTLLWLW